MYRKNNILLIIIILILCTGNLFSQNFYLKQNAKVHNYYIRPISKKPFIDVPGVRPDLIISVTGGLSLPLSDLKGDLSTVSLNNGATSAKAYFEKYGFNVGLQGQLPLDKKSRFRVTMSVLYNQFTNSGNDSSGSTTIEPKLNFIQFGVGAVWALNSFNDITPYINIEANANVFGGSIDFINNTSGLSFTAEYNHGTRYGFTAAAGLEKAFNKSFGGYFGVKYAMANILGKSSDLTGARELNDESYVVNGFSISQKTISFVGVYLGLSLYIRD